MRDNLYKIIEKSLTLEREIIQYPQNDSLIFFKQLLYSRIVIWVVPPSSPFTGPNL